jgi:hypothetical protein
LSSCGPGDPTMQRPTVLFKIHGRSNPGQMTEDIRMDHWHLTTHHWTTIWKTQSMDSDDWQHMTEYPRKSKRDWGTARPTKSCWLHNPNGLPFPWLTMQGTICHETQIVYHMECITTGWPWIVERFPWLDKQWHQPKLANISATITHRMLGHLWTQNWWILSNHRDCMVLRNPRGAMQLNNPECTEIPGWIYIHMDGNTDGNH